MIKVAFDNWDYYSGNLRDHWNSYNNSYPDPAISGHMHRDYFYNKNIFEIIHTKDIKKNDVFIYPIQVNYDFFYTEPSGKLVIDSTFEKIPESVIELISDHKGFLLINYQMEPEVEVEHLKKIYSVLSEYNIPSKKVIYVNGCINCDYHGKKVPGNLNLLYYSCGLRCSSEQIEQEGDVVYDPNKKIDKLFLVLNKRRKTHRSSLLYRFYENSLLDKSFFSYNDPYETNFDFDHFQYLVSSLCPDFDAKKLKDVYNLLPIILDNYYDSKSGYDPSGADLGVENLYENSLLSIVTESKFEDDIIQTTEKIFKPIRRKHPFIVLGPCQLVKNIQRLGFKTFNEFWNEEYDDIADPIMRLNAVVKECETIATWSDEKIADFNKKVQPILEYNFEHLKSLTPEVFFVPKLRAILAKNLPR